MPPLIKSGLTQIKTTTGQSEMYDEKVLKRVIKQLMIQVEEEKRSRIEVIQAFAKLPLLEPFSIKTPTDEEIEKRIDELSQV
jgi:hypothetical protein